MPPAAARARSFPGRRPVSVAAGRWRAGPAQTARPPPRMMQYPMSA